jgi:hypothetical protein
MGDRGYDAESIRQGLRDRRIHPLSCETQHRAWQWAGALALGSRTDIRLAESVPPVRIRYEKRADIHEAFLSLGCALICWRFRRVDWAAV